jgi:hypothetical protein
MANRYHTSNPQRSISAGKGPTPGNTGSKHSSTSYSTVAWTADIGPAGPKRNTVKFPEIKVQMKQHLADDGAPLSSMLMDKSAAVPGAVGTSIAPPVGGGGLFGPAGGAPTAVPAMAPNPLAIRLAQIKAGGLNAGGPQTRPVAPPNAAVERRQERGTARAERLKARAARRGR